MWQATYKKVNKSGLQPELIVSIEFSNDTDDTVYPRDYTVMPGDFNSDGFNAVVQSQIDILNAKDAIMLDSVQVLLDKPLQIDKIVPLK